MSKKSKKKKNWDLKCVLLYSVGRIFNSRPCTIFRIIIFGNHYFSSVSGKCLIKHGCVWDMCENSISSNPVG